MSAMWSLTTASLESLRNLPTLRGASSCSWTSEERTAPFRLRRCSSFRRLGQSYLTCLKSNLTWSSTREKFGLIDRLTFIAGDFFCDDLPSGDVIAMGYVMSNWYDEQCEELLSKAFRACEPGGSSPNYGSSLLTTTKMDRLSTAVMHLFMQVETNGVHRTSAEFFSLMKAAGFRDLEVVRSSQR